MEYEIHPKPGSPDQLPTWMMNARSWVNLRPTFDEMVAEAASELNHCITLYPLLVRQGEMTEQQSQHKLACKAATLEYLRTLAELNAPDYAEVKAYRINRARKRPQGWCGHGLKKAECPECSKVVEP
ncbi:MAG TPA: hypothetical protein VGH19_16050 [Verrucomicrobiae bacterium]